jgi:hypothetical protein
MVSFLIHRLSFHLSLENLKTTPISVGETSFQISLQTLSYHFTNTTQCRVCRYVDGKKLFKISLLPCILLAPFSGEAGQGYWL